MKENIKLPVKLKAMSEMSEGQTKAYLLARIRNVHAKEWQYLLLAASDTNDDRVIRRKLLDAGVSRELSKDEWKQIYAELRKPTDAYFVFSDKPGYIWVNGTLCYITTNAQVIGEYTGCPPFPAPDSKAFTGDESSQGKLEEWQKNVAEPALHSECMVLALCSAFAGYCIYFTNIKSGGFHFYGQSSGGKSTVLLAGASVRGNAGIVSSWKTTEAACEETAEAHNHNLLIKDELKLLDKSPDEAARKAMDICYMLGDGRGKRRSLGYQKSPASWLLVMLSAGERSLGQHASDGGLERMKGEEVRLVDVPVDDNQEYGVVNSLPEGMNAGEFIEFIQNQCCQYYGTAGPEFVGKLLRKGEDNIRAKLAQLINKFLIHHKMDDCNDGVQRRIALRFALAYASGILAVNLKILPYDRKDIMKAVSACYCMAKKPVAVKKEGFFKKKFISELLSPNLLNVKSEGYSRDELESRDILVVTIKNQVALAVKKDVFKEALLADEKLLRQHDILFTDAKGRSTRQIPINGGYLSRRYCLKAEALRLFLY
ncbi:DUF927 domain-containing protein [Lelliottia wanjuensis]|uniref:DUF927 domain-containing protein n=1 Tax=Lelliottia wanjuensis TaxID=3050585 RepID=UPI00254BB2C6|nr:DUF927 domain-containing protein [Lelliottia sp. V106_9]